MNMDGILLFLPRTKANDLHPVMYQIIFQHCWTGSDKSCLFSASLPEAADHLQYFILRVAELLLL
jgi:hypothetical protein